MIDIPQVKISKCYVTYGKLYFIKPFFQTQNATHLLTSLYITLLKLHYVFPCQTSTSTLY
jgi:hypothetical protein